MDCKKALTTVSLSTRLGSVEVECSPLAQCMQELSQQVDIQINSVVSVVFSKQLDGNFSKQISKSLYLQKQVGCLNYTLITWLHASLWYTE